MRPEPDQDPNHGGNAWSLWGIRLVALLCIALVISLGSIWVEAFYRGVAVSSRLSFQPSDLPYMPPHTFARPIIGNHFFGDFQIEYAYASNLRHSISPYLGSAPDNYPPFAVAFFAVFTIFSLRTAAVLYLLLGAAMFLVPLWLLLAPLRREYRVIFLTPLALLTVPFASFLDRGNDIGIAVGLVAWAMWAWKSERWLLCGAFLSLAIALKGYPAGLLVVPLALRRYKFAALVALTSIVLTLLPLVAFPGGLSQNLRNLPAAMEGFKLNGPVTQLSSSSLYSIFPKTAGLLLGSSAAHQLLTPNRVLLWLPSILYLVWIFFLIRRGSAPQWCWGPLALASLQLIVPLSFAYSFAWAPLAAIWFAWGSFVDLGDATRSADTSHESVALRIMVLLALIASLTPSIAVLAGSGGFSTALTPYLSPMLLLATLCLVSIQSLRAPSSDPQFASTEATLGPEASGSSSTSAPQGSGADVRAEI